MRAGFRSFIILCAMLAITLPARATSAANYTTVWWNPSEPGWGLQLAHQGTQVSLGWFTYDSTGKAWWLFAMLDKTGGSEVYSGTLYSSTGPGYDVAYNAANVLVSAVGTASLTFTDTSNGTFSYTVNGSPGSKAIARQVWSASVPLCIWNAQPDLTRAVNFQDTWWNASEPGWQLNLGHQGDVIFATLHVFDTDGRALFLVASNVAKTGQGAYSGTLYRTTGPAFNASPWTSVSVTVVGSLSLTFTNGNSGTLTYSINATQVTKSITRRVFAAPGTVCGFGPGAPTITNVTRAGTQASVSFTTPASDGGFPISQYVVQASPVGGGQAIPMQGAASPLTFTGLAPHTAYSFIATAFNAAGGGTASAPVVGAAFARNDFNGDANSDILYRNSATGQIYRILMNGTTGTNAAIAYTEPNTAWTVVADADFNGDHVSDLLWRNSATGQVFLQPFGSNGMPNGGAIIYTEPDAAWKIVHTPDLDGDGNSDLLWWNSSTGQVYAMLMNGTTIAAQGVVYQEPNTAWKIAAVGDFAGSGKENQLLYRNSSTGQVYLMTVTFSGGVFSQTGAMVYQEPNTQWRIVTAADFDGDGKSDILWRNETTGQVYLMLMNGAAIASQAMVYQEPNTAWKIVAWGDYNGDRRADLLYRNETTGQVYMMLMNGLTISTQALVYTEPNTLWRVLGGLEYTTASGTFALAPISFAPTTLQGAPVNSGRIGGVPVNQTVPLR